MKLFKFLAKLSFKKVWLPVIISTTAVAAAVIMVVVVVNSNKCKHEEVTDYAVAATCTESGLTEGSHCSLCDEVFVKQEVTPALGHDTKEHEAKAATCTEDGYKAYEACSRCDYTTYEAIPAKKHTIVTIPGKAPTCTESGLTEGSHCSVCNTVFAEQEVIDALGHTKVIDEAKAPTCTETGLTEGSHCSVCNIVLEEQDVISAIGHDKVYHEEKSATCTEEGYKAYETCTVCDYTTYEAITAGHKWNGSNCSVCGAKKESEGLKYTLSGNSTYYTLSGIGTCTDLDIVIPSVYNGLPVTSIGSFAFYYCSSLTSINIPESVTSIGSDAFYYCSSLTSINIPESVTSIGSSAFYDCTALTEIYYNATALNDLSSSNNLVFHNAGKEGEGITVTIGKNVTKIPAYLFYPYYYSSYSPKITSVIFEEGSMCKSIGNSAFSGCSSLISINIPEGVTSIGSDAFYNCSSLKSISIPEGVTSVGSAAFSGCTALTEIHYNATDLNDLSKNNYVFSNAGKEGEGITVTIGKNVTKIPAYLFFSNYWGHSYSPKITSVIFEEDSNCESIGSAAFFECSSLTSINIPDSITSIGSDAFIGCSSLTSINIPDSVTSIGSYAFSDCSSLTSINIPDSVTSIGSYAFYDCTALTEIYYNATDLNDLSYGNKVFYNAGSKGVGITVTIGKNVTKIPAYLFYPYSSNNYYHYSPRITSVIFEEGSKCESIGEYAFYYCYKLTSINIPDSVTSIGEYAFDGCSSLTVVYITDISSWCAIKFANSDSNPLRYAKNLYLNNKLVTELVIPNGVTKISNYAFYNCNSLTSITIPASVTEVGGSAFSGCPKLIEVINKSSLNITVGSSDYGYVAYYAKQVIRDESESNIIKQGDYIFYNDNGSYYLLVYTGNDTDLVLPDNINGNSYSIYNYAFYECSSLTSVTIPNSVTSIGKHAFFWCSSLTSVTIGNGVTSIGYEAFYGCTALTEIYYNATDLNDLSSYDNVFSYIGNAGEGITVTIGKDVTKIPAYLFYPYYDDYSSYSPEITSVIFEEGSKCESIGERAFYECSSLTSVTIPNSVTSIGEQAFYNCTALTEIYYNATALNDLSYDNEVFYNAGTEGEGITVTIGKNVTKIPAYLFYYCNGITSVIFEEGSKCESIGEYAFCNYSDLTNVYITDLASWCAIKFADYTSNPLCYAKNLYLNNKLVTDLVIPEGVTKIGSYAFYNYRKLTSIIVDENNTVYHSEGNCLIETASKTLILGCNNSIIPSDGSVTSIGYLAFYGCSGLNSINIPKSVTSIGKYAFDDCRSLTGVYITDIASWCAIEFAYNSNPLYYAKNLYLNNELVTELVIPEGVTSIGDDAFKGCSSLKSISIPEGVTSVGSAAFSGCTALTEIHYNATALNDLSSSNEVFNNAGSKGVGITVTIGKNVTKIPAYLFYPYSYDSSYSPKITSVIFEEGSKCESIGEFAFDGCSSLKSITIPNSVTSIGERAFSGCSSLKSITIPNSVTSIGSYAFSGCSSLESITVDENNTIYHSEGNCIIKTASKTLIAGCKNSIIPSDGSVTSIGDEAFRGCDSLTSINIPDSVTSIGERAFNDCDSLTSVTIGDSVTSIGYSAFWYCSSLTSINIPDSVTSIGSYAFYKCSSLTSVTIGNGVTSIGSYAFHYCYKLIEVINKSSLNITVGSYNYGYVARYAKQVISDESESNIIKQGDYIFYNDNGSYYLLGYEGNDTDLVLPDNINGNSYSIYNYAFYECISLTSVTIGNGVTSIGDEAFRGCDSLTSVTIGNGVTSIGDEAFHYCYKLIEVINKSSLNITAGSSNYGYVAYYAKQVISDESENHIIKHGDYIFYNDNGSYYLLGYEGNDTDLVLPDNINGNSYSIYNYAFYKCSSLKSINIPDSVTSIGSGAFEGCSSLTSINIPESVTSIGNAAFYCCSSLTSINIPNSVTSIGYSAFYNCSSLTSINIPEKVTSLGYNAFSNCTALTEIHYNATALNDLSKNDEVFNNAGSKGVGITVTIGKDVTKIPAYLFYPYYDDYSSYSPEITSVIFEEGSKCESIGEYAFYGCGSLTSIEIPNSVTSIGSSAFSNCDSLTSIEIPNSVTSIGYDAFSGCDNLIQKENGISYVDKWVIDCDTSVTEAILRDNTVGIGNSAFSNCDSLTSVTIPESVTSIGNYAFYNCTALTEIYYNATALNDLSSGVFSNAGQDGEGITVTIGKNVTKIPAYLFRPYSNSYSPKITSVIFEEGSKCESIGEYAFYDCSKLASINIPEGVTSIGSSAFYGCSSLTNVTIGNGVTSIGERAFYGCSALTSINIPESVTSIGDEAFYDCTALTEIYYNATALNDLSSSNYVFYKAGKEGEGITVTIGKNVTKIPAYLFYSYYFDSSYSPKITSIIFEEGSKCESIGEYAFYKCSSLTSITIPNSVTSIGSGAFSGCSSLKSIEIPESVTSIGSYAFYDCTALTEIYYNATALNDLSKNNEVFHNAGSKGVGITVTIGKNVTKIPAYLFYPDSSYNSSYSPKITSVIFEEGSKCESIGSYAFAWCSSLTSINIPDSVTSIGSGAFLWCSSLTSITIPDSVTSIGSGAFLCCSSLTSIIIPEGVTSIGSSAFEGCRSLTSINIPNSVTSIGEHAFYECSSLTSITIPNSVTSIGSGAFIWCSSLTSIEIPNSVTSIGKYAFGDCSSLTSVTFADPNGWYVTRTENATSGTNLTLTNASQNATYLESTYDDYYWYKK